MDSRQAQRLFAQHASAMAYVEVRLPTGDLSIGSAFHVGEGVFVTARHVVAGNEIVSVKITEPVGIPLADFYRDLGASDAQISEIAEAHQKVMGRVPRMKHHLEPLQLASEPIYDTDDSVDLALFRVRDLHPETAMVRLGWHYDDFIYRDVWHLNEAIIFGYPPIPFTTGPRLVAARSEVNAFAALRDCPYVHFILSCTPRGGFSGGLAMHEEGFALGVVTRALTNGDTPLETGYFAVLSIERIRVCLEDHGMMPLSQATPPWQK